MKLGRVTVFGYHGMRNFGDDCFLQFLLDVLDKFGVPEIGVYARPGTLPYLSTNIAVKPFLPWKRYFRGYEKWIFLFIDVLKSEGLLFCAGSLFTILPFKIANATVCLLKFLKPRLKVMGIGISIGPFNNQSQEKTCKKLFGKFDCVLVRDQRSYSYLVSWGYEDKSALINDLAFDWRPTSSKEKKRPIVVGIALNDHRTHLMPGAANLESERDLRVLRSITRLVKQKDVDEVRIFITCADAQYGDHRVALYLEQALSDLHVPVEVIEYDGFLDKFISSIGGCDYFIASRLHAGFFAAKHGGKVAQLAYADKVKDFYHGRVVQNIDLYDAYEFDPEIVATNLLSETNINQSNNPLVDVHIKQQVADAILKVWQSK